ncbi:MAG: DUF4143 domain-containing protein [Solirubrobacteraceae bacterium]
MIERHQSAGQFLLTGSANAITAPRNADALTGRAAGRRERFFASYSDTIIDRDLSTIAEVQNRLNVTNLLSALAATSASLMNIDSFARDLGLASNTVRAHATLLDTLFLTQRVPPVAQTSSAELSRHPRHKSPTAVCCAI